MEAKEWTTMSMEIWDNDGNIRKIKMNAEERERENGFVYFVFGRVNIIVGWMRSHIYHVWKLNIKI